MKWAKLVDAPSVSADGRKFEIASNIGTPTDMAGRFKKLARMQ